MTDKEFENKISSAFEDMVPEGAFEKITAKIPARSEEGTRINMTRKNNILKFILPFAACLLLGLGIGGFLYTNNFAVSSVVAIDVNPSIEITANKNDKVIDVTAVNDDAEKIIDDMDLKKSDLNVAVNAIVGSMVKNGYMENDKNGILVTVLNDDTEKADTLRKEIVTDIDSALKENNAEAQVINQTVSITDEVRQFANDNYISIGKAVFIMNIASKDSTLDSVELSKMSISELTILVQEKKIDISDFCDVGSDDNVWDNVADAIVGIEDGIRKDNEFVSNEVVVNETDAKLAALAHAKLKTSDVENVTVELYTENNRSVYYVEFVYNDIMYSYEIDCETGEIITCGTDFSDEPEGEVVVDCE